MDLLIDTNLLIPVEPTSVKDVEPTTPVIAELLRLVQETRGRVVIHPDAFSEIGGDRDTGRRDLRRALLGKYPRLESPPDLSQELASIIGHPLPETHDWIDARLLEAVRVSRADVLVTDDAALRRRARAAGMGDSVLTSSEALELLRTLYEPPVVAPPAVNRVFCSGLNARDPILDSLRGDYPEFDTWFAKAIRMRRVAWVVVNEDESYAAVVIIKEEDPGEHGLQGKLLKMCTFKVAETHRGSRYGELLLKPVLDHANVHRYDRVFVEAKPDNEDLFDFLEAFGFRDAGVLKNGTDPVYAKTVRAPNDGAPHLDALAFHVEFGPPAMRWLGVPAFVVPIQPEYHRRLFPEAERQLALTQAPEPHGNGIRKAYLCRAPSRRIKSGDVLYFYRSESQELTVVGVAEDVHVLSGVSAIVQAAGKRTLYTYGDIKRMAESGTEVLVIGFRQARVCEAPVSYRDLRQHEVLRGAPQAVTAIREEAATWLAQTLRL